MSGVYSVTRFFQVHWAGSSVANVEVAQEYARCRLCFYLPFGSVLTRRGQVRHATAAQWFYLEGSPALVLRGQALRRVERSGADRPVRPKGDFGWFRVPGDRICLSRVAVGQVAITHEHNGCVYSSAAAYSMSHSKHECRLFACPHSVSELKDCRSVGAFALAALACSPPHTCSGVTFAHQTSFSTATTQVMPQTFLCGCRSHIHCQHIRCRPFRRQLMAGAHRPSRRQLVLPLSRIQILVLTPQSRTRTLHLTTRAYSSFLISFRRLYFVFDEPVTLSVVRLWNYGAQAAARQHLQQPFTFDCGLALELHCS